MKNHKKPLFVAILFICIGYMDMGAGALPRSNFFACFGLLLAMAGYFGEWKLFCSRLLIVLCLLWLLTLSLLGFYLNQKTLELSQQEVSNILILKNKSGGFPEKININLSNNNFFYKIRHVYMHKNKAYLILNQFNYKRIVINISTG